MWYMQSKYLDLKLARSTLKYLNLKKKSQTSQPEKVVGIWYQTSMMLQRNFYQEAIRYVACVLVEQESRRPTQLICLTYNKAGPHSIEYNR